MKISSLLLCSAAAVLWTAPLYAQAPSEKARLDEIARNAAQQFAAARAEADQTRPANPPPAGQHIELTLDDAVERALDRNLQLAVERLNPQTFDLAVARLQSVYRPTLTSQIGQQSRINPPTSTLNGGNVVDNDTTTYNTGVSQAMKWGGGTFSFQFNNNKQVSSNAFNNYNPAFNSNFAATYVQPLLRGLTIDSTRQQLKVTALNRDISETQLKGTVAQTVASVRNAYWELVYAVQALDVAKGSEDLANKLVEDNRARVEVGTMAPLDVATAEAEAATRRQATTTAESALGTAQLTLKQLIVSGTDDPLWSATITPVDRATFREQALDVETAVRKALAERSDMETARKTVDANDVTMKWAHNQELPALDMTASYGSVGLGGTQYQRSGSGVTSTIIGTVPGGYSDAWRTLSGLDYPNWNVSFNFSYPLGQSAQEASYARAKVQRNQAAAQMRALELSIATEVTNIALQVESNLKRYEAATAARELAETRLNAEQSRFEVGLSTNFFVVQAQRDLATAQNSELRALLDYRHSLVDFERVQQAPATGRGTGVTTVTGN
ncbi:MAG TPA: TolC family protein [Vicinamibacterales bacterium]|jgi:outer membrane protein TolC|nr:TolC family protein [Vicinamibacterales bacterium]